MADLREPVEIVREFVTQCWGAGDVSLVHSLVHPDYVVSGPLVGTDAVIANIRAYRTAFPDLTVDIVECIAQGDAVATLIRLQGTHLHTWKGITATGRTVDYHEAAFWSIREGQIVWGRFVAESLSLRIQLGQIPSEVWPGITLSTTERI